MVILWCVCYVRFVCVIFFFKQKTAYEMRISDWVQTCALPIFAKLGVPMLDAGSGEDLVSGGTAAGEAAAKDYGEHRYHQPADEYDPTWDWSGAIDDLPLYYRLGRGLAEGDS